MVHSDSNGSSDESGNDDEDELQMRVLRGERYLQLFGFDSSIQCAEGKPTLIPARCLAASLPSRNIIKLLQIANQRRQTGLSCSDPSQEFFLWKQGIIFRRVRLLVCHWN